MMTSIYPKLALIVALSIISIQEALAFDEDFQSFAGDLLAWNKNGTLTHDGETTNIVLKVGPGELQVFEIPGLSKGGTLTLDVFDFGEIPNANNRTTSRVGLSNDGGNRGKNLFVTAVKAKPPVGAANYYYPNATEATKKGNFFGWSFFGNRDAQRTPPGPVAVESALDADDRQGSWIAHTFDVHPDGVVIATLTAPGYSASSEIGTIQDLNYLFIWGSANTRKGVLVDNIRFKPKN